MRILQVGKYYHPIHGGIETVVKALSEGLLQSGDEVTVLCSSSAAKGSEDVVSGVKVIRVPAFGRLFSQPLSPGLPAKLLQLARDADIVHMHTPNPIAEVASLALRKSVPVIATYHSDIVRQKIFMPFYGPVLRRFLRRANMVAVATARHIECSPVLINFRPKCKVIPFGLDPNEFRKDGRIASLSNEIKRKHGKFILFVGRLVSYKGLETLLEAMQPTSATLVVIGDGPLKRGLEEKAYASGISGKVVFLGSLDDHDQLLAYYHACEFLVLPSVSRNEAFGLVQLEAMACGKPVITTKLDSGITEATEHEVSGLHLEPGNSAELAKAMHDLLLNQDKLKLFGEAALLRFRQSFTRSGMIRSYRDLYLKAAHIHRQHPQHAAQA